MAIYSLANRTSGVTSATDALEIIAGSSNAYKLMELGLTLNAATATTLGFGKPAAIGVTPTSPINVLTEDNSSTTGATRTALAWGTQPTIPTNFARRVSLPATIGAGIIWTFPRGFGCVQALSTTLWNLVTGSVLDVWIVVDE
jgi:hypothetical protein